MMTSADIKVYESAFSTKVIAKFDTIEELLEWNKKNDVYADQVEVNSCLLYGWDELYDFV